MPDAPCICWDKGCEHQLAWHRLIANDRAQCEVPGCFCITATICTDHCIEGERAEEPEGFLLALGIAAG